MRFDMGVTNAIRRHASGFFPTLAEFMDYVPTSSTREYTTCERCKDSSGFLSKSRIKNGKPEQYAERCDHKPVEVQE